MVAVSFFSSYYHGTATVAWIDSFIIISVVDTKYSDVPIYSLLPKRAVVIRVDT